MSNNSKTVWFHLRWKSGDEILPASQREILVVAIADSKDGLFYLFEPRDRKSNRHKYFKSAFDKKKIQKKSFVSFCNDKQLLSGIVLDEYWDSSANKFRFNNYYLVPTSKLGETYSCKSSPESE